MSNFVVHEEEWSDSNHSVREEEVRCVPLSMKEHSVTTNERHRKRAGQRVVTAERKIRLNHHEVLSKNNQHARAEWLPEGLVWQGIARNPLFL